MFSEENLLSDLCSYGSVTVIVSTETNQLASDQTGEDYDNTCGKPGRAQNLHIESDGESDESLLDDSIAH